MGRLISSAAVTIRRLLYTWVCDGQNLEINRALGDDRRRIRKLYRGGASSYVLFVHLLNIEQGSTLLPIDTNTNPKCSGGGYSPYTLPFRICYWRRRTIDGRDSGEHDRRSAVLPHLTAQRITGVIVRKYTRALKKK